MEQKFQIIDEKTEEFEKFNLSCSTVNVKFSINSTCELDDCLKELFKLLMRKYDLNDFISIQISTDSLELGSVSEFFKPVSSYSEAEFLNFIKNAIYNNMYFSIKDIIKIVLTCVHISEENLVSSDENDDVEYSFQLLINEISNEFTQNICPDCDARISPSSFQSHLCYMPIAKNVETNLEENIFVFYDFETMQKKIINDQDVREIHIANLCVARQVCDKCNKFDKFDDSKKCDHCGGGDVRVFKGNAVKSFLNFLLNEERPKNIKSITCIAHNSQGFDSQFILKHLIKIGQIPSFIILKGANIVCMTVKVSYNFQIRFLDSYCFIKEKLEKFPEIFEFKNFTKGIFPFLFNTKENQNYVGPIPDEKFYSPDTMSKEEREKFQIWHNELRESDYQFNFQKEIVEYCKMDVEILRRGCYEFRQKIFQLTTVDPFGLYMPVTLAGVCNKFYIKKILPKFKKKIGLIPNCGYRAKSKKIRESLEWLLILEKATKNKIVHIGYGHEYRLPGLDIIVNGFSISENGTKTVYLHYDCARHGCPNHSLTDSQKNSYEKIVETSTKIRSSGYHLIEMWSCAFKDIKIQNKEFLENHRHLYADALNPRDAFFGGRAENTVTVHSVKNNEKIRYIDICSLYPYINKYGKYPVGHPTIKIGYECDEYVGTNLEGVEGLVKCRVLPPRDLLYPVLPIHSNNNTLMFPLCKKCCDDLVKSNCTHEEKSDREITGTWVSDELKKAISKGYKVTAIYEIWQYKIEQYDRKTKSGGLFADYVDTFLKHKQEASGWPKECDTNESKLAYIQHFLEQEGILLEYENIKENEGLRYIAKHCLNSLWGKFGQKNYPITNFDDTGKKLIEIANSEKKDLNTVVPLNDNHFYYKWQNKDKDMTPSKTVNVPIAVYTTAQARLKLYEYLEKLGKRVLYYDTDSCFYVTKNDNELIPTGNFLGDMKDELIKYGKGSYIREFVSIGPKRYSYIVVKPDKTEEIVTKISGLQLNSSNQDKFSHEEIKKLAEGRIDEIEHISHEIRRTPQHDVITKSITKRFKVNRAPKRVFNREDESYPYGYKKLKDSTDR